MICRNRGETDLTDFTNFSASVLEAERCEKENEMEKLKANERSGLEGKLFDLIKKLQELDSRGDEMRRDRQL